MIYTINYFLFYQSIEKALMIYILNFFGCLTSGSYQ